MKHLTPLRTLRLLTALSAVPSPVYVPLLVGLATPMVATSTVLGQSGTTGGLPPLPPATSAFGANEANKESEAAGGAGAPAAPSLLPPSSANAALPPLPGLNQPQQGSTQASANPKRDQATALTSQAKLAFDRGDIASARRLLDQAKALGVPDNEFEPGTIRPWQLELAVKGREAMQANSGVATASSVQPAGGLAPNQQPVESGVYQPQKDGSRVAAASGVLSSYDADTNGAELYREGMNALAAGNNDAAMSKFRAAYQKRQDLDQPTLTQLKDKMAMLQVSARQSGAPEEINAVSAANQDELRKRQRLFSEVTGEIADSERLAMQNKPLEALDKLRSLRVRIGQSDASNEYKKSLLTTVDQVSGNIEKWVEQNKVAIQLDQTNKQIEDRMRVEADQLVRSDLQVSSLVDQYNTLIDQRRFDEAVEVARRVAELRPGSEIAAVMTAKSKIQANNNEYELLREQKEYGFANMMMSTEFASIPQDDRKILSFGPANEWSQLSRNRLKSQSESKMLPSEKRIWEALDESFSGSFDRRPLVDVMRTFGEMYGIPIDIDERSLQVENVSIDQPVSLDLQGNSIKVKSALNLMLEKLNLRYVVKNETLTIQGKQFSQPELITVTYSIKDLVIPIPNFVSDYNTGMAGALQAAYNAQTSFASASVPGQGRASALAAANPVSIDPRSEVLTQLAAMPGMNGQMGPGGFGGMVPGMSSSMYGASTPGGFPGATQGFGGSPLANFGELIQLIETVVTPDAWESNSGTSSMIEHRQTLSLLVRAPQETHEALADLLKSLRDLMNLQVTIEVRFIQLQDTFFERIGIDFDIKKDDNVRRLPNDDSGPRVAVGLSAGNTPAGPSFTSDLDIGLSNNFSVNPPFGAPDINQATTFGLAILSDLELFFFLEASQGNSRQNVLNAPKVTMFDGQIASINDFAQRPFVVSFEPVVGDFAVAQRPIVVVLNEGTQLNVQSVVSQDRRFVRMTLVPQFTRLENADRQFTFQGRRSSNTGTSILNPNTGLPTGTRNQQDEVIEGTTVQQPTLGTTSIQTTVNVPDGGTILLGGIKRLSEGRVERGTPILSKIPYLNRLFKNNAIGRETSTLMMTVSPRIIIPEEEEEKLTGTPIP
ncbi:hypothetical protein SH449x_005351 [Pirellulaceae bacterium SH449]